MHKVIVYNLERDGGAIILLSKKEASSLREELRYVFDDLYEFGVAQTIYEKLDSIMRA